MGFMDQKNQRVEYDHSVGKYVWRMGGQNSTTNNTTGHHHHRCEKEDKGHPLVNVNVKCGKCGEDSCDCIDSAFRAINVQNQPVVSGDQVLYPVVEFDLNDEYDAATSTFIPKQDGIYSLTASLAFFPESDNTAVNYSVDIAIRVNGEFALAGQSFQGQDFFLTLVTATTVSGILQLNAGDEVDVQFFISPTLNGFIDPRPWSTHFEAARFSYSTSAPCTSARRRLPGVTGAGPMASPPQNG
ncbi:MAG: hypothetical protein ACQEV7_09480 [Bacillota bacterium]